ncbi:hypothetical protein F4553_002945 [Allocatelliglobosispora scoriae]|uniref:LppM domain-containing protein n=1 Tax=Allocatelliglobosispora scoriae TaxID=643052 RepID=A0A841BQG6_9ACTN|nr:hypothetical protein [Allocatelliglobosispora scoriae]MBB5869566.1 hypothetical protein [Allocatelliglobosispora scoriae]
MPMRKLTTPLRSLAMLAIAAVTLSGCMKVDMAFTINPDDTVSGTAVFAVDKRLAGLAGSEDNLVREMTNRLGNVPTATEEKRYSEGDFIGTTYTYTKTPLSSFSGSILKIAHRDGRYTLDAVLDLSAYRLDDPAIKAFADSFTVKIAMTFPGKVTSGNGTIDGNTVTWTPKAGQSTSMHAVAEEASTFPVLLVSLFGGVLLLLVIVAVAIVLVASRRRKATADELPAIGHTALPTTDSTVIEELPTGDAHSPSGEARP